MLPFNPFGGDRGVSSTTLHRHGTARSPTSQHGFIYSRQKLSRRLPKRRIGRGHRTSLMESGGATESISAAAQLAECCSIPLVDAASFLETTDGSIPVCWPWAALQLILLLCRPPRICTSPQWLNKPRGIAVIKKNPLPKGHDSAQVPGSLLAHDPFRPSVC